MGAPSVGLYGTVRAVQCDCCERSLIAFAPGTGFARGAVLTEIASATGDPHTQSNFPLPPAVFINAMITGAIVFGMVGVAAGFTWDYVINRGK